MRLPAAPLRVPACCLQVSYPVVMGLVVCICLLQVVLDHWPRMGM